MGQSMSPDTGTINWAKCTPPSMTNKVTAKSDEYGDWIRSILSSLSSFEEMWIKKEEDDRSEASIVHMKFISQSKFDHQMVSKRNSFHVISDIFEENSSKIYDHIPEPEQKHIESLVIDQPNEYSEWIEATLSSVCTFEEMWIIKDKYDRSAPSVVHVKFITRSKFDMIAYRNQKTDGHGNIFDENIHYVRDEYYDDLDMELEDMYFVKDINNVTVGDVEHSRSYQFGYGDTFSM